MSEPSAEGQEWWEQGPLLSPFTLEEMADLSGSSQGGEGVSPRQRKEAERQLWKIKEPPEKGLSPDLSVF